MDPTDLTLSDEEVALLIQKGDKEKFSLLVKRYEDKLFRYGRRFLSSRENIEDIVQDVFVSTFQNINNFDSSLRFSSWIYRIAHNAFVNSLKKNSKSPIIYIDFDTLISHPVYEEPKDFEKEQKEMKEMVDKGLEKLSSKYKEVIILHYLEEMSYKEISDILRIPMGTVGIRIKRAKESLRVAYAKMNLNYGK